MVIPAYNSESTIATAIGSALEQELIAEVIVVDDGSIDGTVAAAKAVGDPRVTILEQPNSGPGAARNTGAAAATASHLVFLDADDCLLPDALLTFATGNEDRPLIRTGAIWRTPDGKERIGLATRDPRPFPRGAPLAGSFAISRALFEEIGGYDHGFRFGENSELLLRAAARSATRGGTTAFVGAATVVWVQLSESRNDRYESRRRVAAARMVDKHGDLLRDDPETLHNHHAIAAELNRRNGDTRTALRHGVGAVRARPTAVRSWARLVRIALTRRHEAPADEWTDD